MSAALARPDAPRVRLGWAHLALAAGGVLLLAGFFAAALLFAWPGGSAEPGRITVPAVLVPEPGGPPFHSADGRFYLVHLRPGEGSHQGFGEPSITGGLLALSTVNPHTNLDPDTARNPSFSATRCELPWRADFRFQSSSGWFRDPCLGSTFNEAGVRVFGPSPWGMWTLPLSVRADGSVIVDTTQPQRGGYDNPLRAIPYSAP